MDQVLELALYPSKVKSARKPSGEGKTPVKKPAAPTSPPPST
jgi:hypothetical protein